MLVRNDMFEERYRDAQNRLAAALRDGAPADDLDALSKEVDLLQTLRRKRDRRRSFRFFIIAIAAVLAAAVVLNLIPLSTADVVMVGSTRALTFTTGPAAVKLLPVALDTAQVIAEQADDRVAWCGAAAAAAAKRDCETVDRLRVNALALNARTTAEVRATGSCFDVTVWDGGGRVDVTFARNPGYQHLDLAEGDVLRVCPAAEASLHLDGISFVMLGERTAGGLAERRSIPTLRSGTLSIENTTHVLQLRPTDTPQVGGLADGTLVVRPGQHLDVSMVGRAQRISIVTGSHQRDAMPSILDWLRDSPILKATIGLVIAIIGAIGALRDRLIAMDV